MSVVSYELLFGFSSSDDDEVMSEFTEFAWNTYQAAQPKFHEGTYVGIMRVLIIV